MNRTELNKSPNECSSLQNELSQIHFFSPFSRPCTGYRWICGFKEIFIPHCPPTCLGGKPSEPAATTTDCSPRNSARFVRTATTASLTRDDHLDTAYAVIGSSRRPIDTPTPRAHETGKDQLPTLTASYCSPNSSLEGHLPNYRSMNFKRLSSIKKIGP